MSEFMTLQKIQLSSCLAVNHAVTHTQLVG